MKIGIRVPSLKRRVAARTSVKRYVRNNLGLKAPRGWGWLTDPKRALYNRIYNRTSVSADTVVKKALDASTPKKYKKGGCLGCGCLPILILFTIALLIAV
jgi:hypothetical protein